MLNPNPQCHHVGEQGLGEVTGHEDGAPMTGVSVLINETSQSSLVPSAMGGPQQKMGGHDQGSGSSIVPESAGASISDLPTSRV